MYKTTNKIRGVILFAASFGISTSLMYFKRKLKMEIISIPVYPIRNRSYRSLKKQDCELMRPPVLASETQKIEGTKSQSLSVLKIIMTPEE